MPGMPMSMMRGARPLARADLQRLGAIERDEHFVARETQHQRQRFGGIAIVVRDQHAAAPHDAGIRGAGVSSSARRVGAARAPCAADAR